MGRHDGGRTPAAPLDRLCLRTGGDHLVLTGDEPNTGRQPGDDVGDFPYLASFANERNFLSQQGIALLLLAAAGFLEFAPLGGPAVARHSVAGLLVVLAAVITGIALRRFTAAERRIRETYGESAQH